MKIPTELLTPVIDWANQNYKNFTPNGFGRQFCVLQKNNTLKEIWDIKKIIVDEHKLHNKKQEPVFKDYCGYITDGGAIHRHKDPNQDNLIHTRFNVMVSKPLQGGEPIQNGVVIKVEEGDFWRCDAGLVEHWCSPVIGNKPRIVLSFGFLV